MTGRWRHLIKRPIDAIADFEFVFERFEVNVARAVLDRLVKNKINEANYGCRVRLRFSCSFAVSFPQLQKLASFAELLENVFHARRVAAVILLDQFFDLLRRRNHDLNVFTEREAKVFRGMKIKWINKRDP